MCGRLTRTRTYILCVFPDFVIAKMPKILGYRPTNYDLLWSNLVFVFDEIVKDVFFLHGSFTR